MSKKKAIKDNVTSELTYDYSIIKQMVEHTFKRKDKELNSTLISKILNDFSNEENSFSFASKLKNENIASSFIVYDSDTAYYLLGGYHSLKKHNGAGVFSLFNAIKEAKRRNLKTFDFEGSMLPEVEKYFRAFGGELTPYYTLNKASFLLETLLKKGHRSQFLNFIFMPLILRIDVDKPYGRKTVFEKIKSKLKEDYWFPKSDYLNYLKSNELLLNFCNKNKVKGIFYYRNCTTPNQLNRKLLKQGNHKLGFHAENTRSFETFKAEIDIFINANPDFNLHSFTKHGSGNVTIGKNHYAPYEPKKYLYWSQKIDIPYLFGNEICDSKQNFKEEYFIPKMFWIHRDYRSPKLNKIEELIEIAKNKTVPVIIHPSNFAANKHVFDDFTKLVTLASQNKIEWIIP